MSTSDMKALGAEAYLYLLPLFEMHATRARQLRSGLPLNTWRHVRTLADARSRFVTTPNSDTLYSSAWLDVGEPVTVTLPPTGGRYLSVALMDVFSNNFVVLRGEPDRAVSLKLVGPDATQGPGAVRAPTLDVWALARIFVAGPHDVPAAQAVQDGLQLAGATRNAEPDKLGPRDDIAGFFAAANRLLADTATTQHDAARLTRFARIGVGPGLQYPARGLEGGQIEAVEAGAREALAGLGFIDGASREGWVYPRPTLGDFGEDHAYRASIALTGLAALPLSEAIYLKATPEVGAGDFNGCAAWRSRLQPASLCGPDGFWSLALYEVTPQGQLFFFDNPANRYSVGSNTPDLTTGVDGEVEVIISSEPPAGGGNWLPAPAGPFALQLRAFRPSDDLVGGRYAPAPVERA